MIFNDPYVKMSKKGGSVMDKEKYLEILQDENNTPPEIARKAGELKKHKFLYRYRTFNKFPDCYKTLSEFLEDELKGEVYLSTPDGFNDPLDCLIFFDVNKISEEDRLITVLANKNEKDKKEILEELRKEYNFFKIQEGYKKDVRCACFTESNKNILMWSHYADCHKGFCIQYNTERIESRIKNNLFPVLYTKERLDITTELRKMSNNAIIKALISKAIDWEYEEEWRIISSDKNMKKCCLKDAIEGIYLGVNCSEDNKKIVCEIADKNKKIKVYEMKINKKEYKLESVKIV